MALFVPQYATFHRLRQYGQLSQTRQRLAFLNSDAFVSIKWHSKRMILCVYWKGSKHACVPLKLQGWKVDDPVYHDSASTWLPYGDTEESRWLLYCSIRNSWRVIPFARCHLLVATCLLSVASFYCQLSYMIHSILSTATKVLFPEGDTFQLTGNRRCQLLANGN